MASSTLRPQIVRVMAAHRGRPVTTTEIYDYVAVSGVAGFDPKTERDLNLLVRHVRSITGA